MYNSEFLIMKNSTNIKSRRCVDKDSLIKHKLNRLRQSAKSRNIDFSLTTKDVENLLSQKSCYFTGENFSSGDYTCLSVDRLDNNIGYVPKNVIACKQSINSRKANLTIKELKSIYRRIKYRKIFEFFLGDKNRNITKNEASQLLSELRKNCKKYNTKCEVTIDGLIRIISHKKCFITRKEIKDISVKNIWNIGNKKIWTDDNIILCCSEIKSKLRLSEYEFKCILEGVTRHKKENELVGSVVKSFISNSNLY